MEKKKHASADALQTFAGCQNLPTGTGEVQREAQRLHGRDRDTNQQEGGKQPSTTWRQPSTAQRNMEM